MATHSTLSNRVHAATTRLRATFKHRPGPHVSVTTTDDAWLFIDGRLVVDHGGLGRRSGSVLLDDLDLVPGRQYKLALFTARRCALSHSFLTQSPHEQASSTSLIT